MPDLVALRRQLTEFDRVVVAFSGGADSAFLAWVANDTLGAERVLAATAVSPSLTMPNGSALATGHWPGDTGVFGNWLAPGFPSFPVQPAGSAPARGM